MERTTTDFHAGCLDFNVTAIGHIARKTPNPNWSISHLTNPDHFILAYAETGEATYFIHDEMQPVKAGDVLFFPRGLIHSAQSNPENPWQFYTVSFDIEFASEADRRVIESLANVIRGLNSGILPPLLSELNQVWTGKRTGYLIRCRSILMELLYLLIREADQQKYNTAHYRSIEKIINLINENFHRSYTIEELAEVSGLSASHFRLLFKKITGESAIQYQNKIKIGKAKDYLLSGNCNVSEAANLVGFPDIYYFSRLFKKITGENPSTYIRV